MVETRPVVEWLQPARKEASSNFLAKIGAKSRHDPADDLEQTT